jgi:hypothetical protein
MVQEQVAFLVEEKEEEMEGQEEPGQVEVEHDKLDLAHEDEAVVEEGLVQVLEQKAEEEQVQVDLQPGRLLEAEQVG